MKNYFVGVRETTHTKDAKIIDDTPIHVVDEEGFRVASFRFYADASAYANTINSIFPCACYCIEGEE